MKYVFICLILIIKINVIANTSDSFHSSFRLTTSIGYYENNGLNKFINYLGSDLSTNYPYIPVKAVTKFPSNVEYQLETYFNFKTLPPIGFYFNLYSTGGRLNSTDYSGSYNLDLLVHRYSFGLIIEYQIFEINTKNERFTYRR